MKSLAGRRWLFSDLGRILASGDGGAGGPPPRALLLFSPPGWGKTALMDELCITDAARLGPQFSLLAWHSVNFADIRRTCCPAAFVKELSELLCVRFPPYAVACRSKLAVQEHLTEGALRRDGGWMSLLRGVLLPLVALRMEESAINAVLGGPFTDRRTGVILVDGLDEAVLASEAGFALLRLLCRLGNFLQRGQLPWLRLLVTCSSGQSGGDPPLEVMEAVAEGGFYVVDLMEAPASLARADLLEAVDDACADSPTLASMLPPGKGGAREELVQQSNLNFQWMWHTLAALEDGQVNPPPPPPFPNFSLPHMQLSSLRHLSMAQTLTLRESPPTDALLRQPPWRRPLRTLRPAAPCRSAGSATRRGRRL